MAAIKIRRFRLGETVVYGGVDCIVVNFQAIKGRSADGLRMVDYVIKSPGGTYYTVPGKSLVAKEDANVTSTEG